MMEWCIFASQILSLWINPKIYGGRKMCQRRRTNKLVDWIVCSYITWRIRNSMQNCDCITIRICECGLNIMGGVEYIHKTSTNSMDRQSQCGLTWLDANNSRWYTAWQEYRLHDDYTTKLCNLVDALSCTFLNISFILSIICLPCWIYK